MNDRLKTMFGVGFAGFIALFALHGKAFVEALMGLPALVQAWSVALPMGVWSVLLALVVSMGVWAFCLHWLPDTKDGRRANFGAETMAILVAIAVTVGQQWSGNRGQLLSAIWMGMAAGFAAPYLAKCIRSLVGLTKK